MVDDGNNQNGVWPLPKFYFEVDFGTGLKGALFQEVSGLNEEVQPIQYRASNSELFSTIKMPGMVNQGNITLKRGIILKDNDFWKWMEQIKLNTIKRRTVLIKLLDEDGKVTMQWQLNNAWPTKMAGADFKSEGNEVAIETLVIAHEQVVVTNG